MLNTLGAWLPKSASNNSAIKGRVSWQEAALLAGLGMLAVVLHAATRNSIQIPGHQGLGWIALLMVGRTASRYRWAAATSAFGAAGFAMLPWWSFNDPFRWLTYLLAGATVDVLYLLLLRSSDKLWLLAVIGGVAHMTKPLLRVVISQFTGVPYGSVLWGVAYPTATHFMFGFFGALAGAGMILYLRRRSELQQQ